MSAQLQPGFGPWNPGIQSQLPAELQHLCTIFRPENVRTSLAEVHELQLLTGLPEPELVAFRPQRLVLHELLIRVTANLSVPDGERIEDLGINFREMTGLLLQHYLEPEMGAIVSEFERVRSQLRATISEVLQTLLAPGVSGERSRAQPPGFFARLLRRRAAAIQPAPVAGRTWGADEILQCQQLASRSTDPLRRAACSALARLLSALFTTNGRAWGTHELIVAVATDLAANTYGSDVIGAMVGPIVRRAAQLEDYGVLPRQQRPIVINTKGPSASGKSTLRPLQKKLAGALGVRWRDFALISPDIWRKQLLDYATLGAAYKYAGAFTSQELQMIDQKLDRYMALKQSRGDMAHLLIDRFRFDSFAPDSDEAGSNLLTRFGHSVYLFFVITPPEQLVERAWKRGLEVGRYKAVDDTLAHSVEAYTGMPDVFFTWARRTDKHIQIELLDNSVPFGALPRTVAFGTNYTFNILDVARLLDIVRFGRVDVNAIGPEA
ncbi:MAG: hypothetical protein JOZ12_15045, partial [Sinobacteraceae bacterium]|nr:hypothetical protein [Nevskiaceae bacterium]